MSCLFVTSSIARLSEFSLPAQPRLKIHFHSDSDRSIPYSDKPFLLEPSRNWTSGRIHAESYGFDVSGNLELFM